MKGKFLSCTVIDFAILTDSSPISTEIMQLRKEMYVRYGKIRNPRTPKLNLLSRPFTSEEFEKFLNEVRHLKALVPQSKIYMIREFVQKYSKEIAEINFMYQVARSQSWKQWIKEITEGKWSCQNIRHLIWKQEDKNKFSTPFIDYTEVS
jgi:hypothetical protein